MTRPGIEPRSPGTTGERSNHYGNGPENTNFSFDNTVEILKYLETSENFNKIIEENKFRKFETCLPS